MLHRHSTNELADEPGAAQVSFVVKGGGRAMWPLRMWYQLDHRYGGPGRVGDHPEPTDVRDVLSRDDYLPPEFVALVEGGVTVVDGGVEEPVGRHVLLLGVERQHPSDRATLQLELGVWTVGVLLCPPVKQLGVEGLVAAAGSGVLSWHQPRFDTVVSEPRCSPGWNMPMLAPVGSVRQATRPTPGTSIGGRNTLAPRDVARSAEASALATMT